MIAPLWDVSSSIQWEKVEIYTVRKPMQNKIINCLKTKGTELSLLLNYGTSYSCTLDKPPCPGFKLVLRPIFIPCLSTQHETLLMF